VARHGVVEAEGWIAGGWGGDGERRRSFIARGGMGTYRETARECER
jgi:hypothetical protein